MNNLINRSSQDNFFKKIFYQAPNPMALIRTEDNVYVEVNKAFEEYFGRKRRQIINKTALEIGLITPEDRLDFLNQIKDTGCARNVQSRVLAKNDEFRFQLVNTKLMKIGKTVFHLTDAIDIPQFYGNKKALRSDIFARTLDSIKGAGVVFVSGLETKKPSVFYMNNEARLFLEKYPLNHLLPGLMRKESLSVYVHSRYYQVRMISSHNNSPLKLIIMERLPDKIYIKEIVKQYDLTPRKREIAVMAATGYSNDEIARKLSLSPYTIKDHLKEIFQIIGVHSRREIFPKFLNLR